MTAVATETTLATAEDDIVVVPDADTTGADRRLPEWVPTVLAVAVILLVWEVAGRTYFEGKATLSPPTAMVSTLVAEWELYPRHITATLGPAAKGWVFGVGIATLLGIFAVLFPITERATLQFAVATYSLPIIAIGPILQVTFTGDKPRAILSGLAVFFSALISTILGLRSASPTSVEVVRALGGGRLAALRKVQIPAALPVYFNGLRISGPAAILGAVLGEYLGRVSTGLGLFMVNSAFALQPDRTWAIALVLTLLSGTAYFLIGLVGRLVAPWGEPDGGRR
ncbi:MAG: ABC transporter permease [Acidimicrobiales bacterium]